MVMLLQPETMHQLVLLAVATRRIIIGDGINAVVNRVYKNNNSRSRIFTILSRDILDYRSAIVSCARSCPAKHYYQADTKRKEQLQPDAPSST